MAVNDALAPSASWDLSDRGEAKPLSPPWSLGGLDMDGTGFGLGFASECPVFLGQSAFLFGERFQPFGLLQKFLCPAFLA